MSLTSVLDDKESPLSRLLAVELPNLAPIRKDHRVRAGADAGELVQPSPPDGVRPAWGTLGAAIDHRLRLALGENPSPGAAVTAGVKASLMLAPTPAIHRVGEDLLGQLHSFVVEHQPFDRANAVLLPAEAEGRVSRLCFLAALYEELFRTRRLWPGTLLDADDDATLDELLGQIPDYAAADLQAMTALAGRGLADLRARTTPGQVRCGPTFTGSSDVGGADADFIADGVLVDVKATTNPTKLRREVIYQLAGYALLDYDDEYQIREVGFYLARTGTLVSWELPDFLERLGARRSLADLRATVSGLPPMGRGS